MSSFADILDRQFVDLTRRHGIGSKQMGPKSIITTENVFCCCIIKRLCRAKGACAVYNMAL